MFMQLWYCSWIESNCDSVCRIHIYLTSCSSLSMPAQDLLVISDNLGKRPHLFCFCNFVWTTWQSWVIHHSTHPTYSHHKTSNYCVLLCNVFFTCVYMCDDMCAVLTQRDANDTNERILQVASSWGNIAWYIFPCGSPRAWSLFQLAARQNTDDIVWSCEMLWDHKTKVSNDPGYP